MRVVVAPDSFKGTFSASEVAAALAAGLREGGAEAEETPVADGGEGTLAVLLRALGGIRRSERVAGPLGDTIDAAWGWFPETALAVIESAEACGLHLSPRTPAASIAASSSGVGQLIRAAARAGARRIIVTVGGTATTDGGEGLLAELGEEVPALGIEVLSDVRVAYGDAARVFAPQKGADAEAVEQLTARLDASAAALAERYGRDPRGVAGTGAGGGISGALWAAYGAPIRSGADAVLDLLGFERRLHGAAAVIAGEGRFDAQSAEGKIVGVIARRARGLPVHVVAGQLALGDDEARAMGVTRCWTATTLDELREAGRAIATTLRDSADRS